MKRTKYPMLSID